MIMLDHIVCIVPNLDEAIEFFSTNLLRTPIKGGKHISFGTHNALISLGSKRYLELLAIDPEDKIPRNTYPFSLNKPISEPRITAWAIRCNDIYYIAEKFKAFGFLFDSGEVKTMSRKTQDGKSIDWKIAINLNQQKITHGTVPFLINWGKCRHPCELLNNACQISHFEITHPSGNLIAEKLTQLGLTDSYIKQAAIASFSLTIAHKGKELTLNG